jgi:hypothetical protein
MEHSVDLSAKTFVQTVSPSSGQAILKKMKKALRVITTDGSGSFDLDALDECLVDLDLDDPTNEGASEQIEVDNSGEDSEEGALDAEAVAADSIGKALALVKQVCIKEQVQSPMALM